jgi:predicted phosphodiesterase
MEKPYFALVVSDIHIKDQYDQSVRPLLALLESIAAKTDNLILLGDIFDFCFGRPRYFKQKFAFFEQALKNLGPDLNIYFVEGNHEFHIGDLGWNIDFQTSNELILDGVKFCHGDHFAPEALYHLFKGFIKSRPLYYLAYLIPPKLLDAYAVTHAKISRALDQDFDHQRIIDCAFNWLGEYKLGVFGHYHVPYFLKRNDQAIAALDCWEQPNCLLIDQQKNVLRGNFQDNSGWSFKECEVFDGKAYLNLQRI